MAKKLNVNFDEKLNSPLFAGVPPKFVKKAATFCEAKEYPAGSPIINEGEKGDFMFIILDGQVDVLKGPKKIHLATLSKGVFLGEGALVSKAPRNASIVAKTNTKVAVFNQQGFDKLSVMHPCIPVTMMNVHNERCKDTVRKLNVAKSKEFILMASVGLVLFVKNSHAILPPSLHPIADQIAALIPDQVMALGGPAAAAIGLKLKQMEMGDIVSKLEKI
jgi:signal-transduction protein with cAMP-binding, CBS, and nucleotidyltransferase domain